jgi:CrcB protein
VTLLRLLVIGAGGALGSVLRYLLGGAVQALARGAGFPWGTFVVNLCGCFVVGALAQLGESRGLFTDLSRAFVFVGVLGGFTTFSAFGNETMNLLRAGEGWIAAGNVAGQVLLGLGGVWLGRAVAYGIWR